MHAYEAFSTLLHAARRSLPLSVGEMESAHRLMKELGFLAVALVQAGTYCYQLSSSNQGIPQPYSFTQYLSLYPSHRGELMKKAEPSSLDNYQRGVYTTLDLSSQAIPPVAQEFLHFASSFHGTNIPLLAFATAAEKRLEDPYSYLPRPECHRQVICDLDRLLCVKQQWAELKVQELIRTLRCFSLLSTTSLDGSVYLHLHPLVQKWCRDMDLSGFQHYSTMMVQVLTTCASDDDLRMSHRLLPHIFDILDQSIVRRLHINDLMGIGTILKDQGYYQRTVELLEIAAMEMIKDNTALNEENTVEMALKLASAYRAQGSWSEAEALDLMALDYRRRFLGSEHPDTIISAADLAVTYRNQEQWSEAEELDLEVLEYRTRTLGSEHPDTIEATASLVNTYERQGRWKDAERLVVGVLEQRMRILGLEHPDTLMAAASVSSTYRNMGRLSEAEKFEVHILEKRKKLQGPEHPDTILATACLAATYGAQRRWEEEAALLASAVQLGLKVIGQENHETQNYILALASVYEKLGKTEEAQKMKELLIYSC